MTLPAAFEKVLGYVENDSPVPDTSLELLLVVLAGVVLIVAGFVTVVLLTRTPRERPPSSSVDAPSSAQEEKPWD